MVPGITTYAQLASRDSALGRRCRWLGDLRLAHRSDLLPCWRGTLVHLRRIGQAGTHDSSPDNQWLRHTSGGGQGDRDLGLLVVADAVPLARPCRDQLSDSWHHEHPGC